MGFYFMKNAVGKLAFYFLISIVGITLKSCGLTSTNIDSRISSPARVNLLEDAVKSYAQSLKHKISLHPLKDLLLRGS